MRVVVLGAGVVGVAAAWYLAESRARSDGDRPPGRGRPRDQFCQRWPDFGQSRRTLGQPRCPAENPAMDGPRGLAVALALARSIRRNGPGAGASCASAPECGHAPISLPLFAWLYTAGSCLQTLRSDTGIQYDQLERGILHIYTDPREFERAIPQAALMRDYGCERVVKSAAECLAIEPALRQAAVCIVGGTYTAGDESGDACLFTQRLADRCRQRGVVFRYDSEIAGLDVRGGAIAGVRLVQGSVLDADAYVAALGSYTSMALRPLGLKLPIYPAKGYSITIPLDATQRGADREHHRRCTQSGVFPPRQSPARRRHCRIYRLRHVNQCDSLRRHPAPRPRVVPANQGGRADRTMGRFAAGDTGQCPLYRPDVACATSSSPAATVHWGWTMACGSGRLLADLVSGSRADIDPSPYARQ